MSKETLQFEECVNKIIQGHAVDVMGWMPEKIFNAVITSPPYWGLRAYGTEPQDWGDWRGELGLEPTPQMYIEHLMMVFDEVKRVLRDDGILLVNIADTYGTHTQKRTGQAGIGIDIKSPANQLFLQKRPNIGLEKSLCAIPERFVVAMMERGWIRRCTIIWAKALSFCDKYAGSCMPDSTTDRPNKNAFEYVYVYTKASKVQFWTNSTTGQCVGERPLGTKGIEDTDWEWRKHSACDGKGCDNKRCVNGQIKCTLWRGHDYYYEQQYEAAGELNVERPRMGQGNQTNYRQKRRDLPEGDPKAIARLAYDLPINANPLGRIIRNVWVINPQPFKDAHFATFPEELVRPMIKMAVPEFVCKKCGRPRVRIYHKLTPPESAYTKARRPDDRLVASSPLGGQKGSGQKMQNWLNEHPLIFKGYSDCYCNAGWRPGVCLDPFHGLGESGQGGGTGAPGLYTNRIAA